MTTTPNRPLPSLSEPDTRPFWEATKEHGLSYQECDDCGGIVFYPRRHCTHCLGHNLGWKKSKGLGTIYTFSIVRQTYHPAFRAAVPYVVAWIDLDEGFRMLSNIVGVEPRNVQIGQRVYVEWEDFDAVSLPVFRPA